MKHMFVVFCSLAIVTGCRTVHDSHAIDSDDGMPSGEPFGEVSDAQVDKLFDFARLQGLDLNSKMEVVYKHGTTNVPADVITNALADVFALSLAFSTLDRNARTYGHIVYCAFLNLGEGNEMDFLLTVMVAEPPVVRQRIRDFLYYALLAGIPEAKREVGLKETKSEYPLLFPDDYQFGKDDPIFLNGRLAPPYGISVSP
jgi:hypothetical protein